MKELAAGSGAARTGRPVVLVVLAHPDQHSLNGAVAAAVVAELQRAGAEALLHDLYRDGFDPRLVTSELGRAPVQFADELTARYAHDLVRADAFVIVHPVWFFHVPAILKGWVDRVVREGFAFELSAEGSVRGLLRARSALVITSANTSPATEASAFGAPLDTFWRTVVFGPAGVREVERLALTPVRGSDEAVRAAWLSEAASAAARLVGSLG